jgi:GxxExxY protein
MEYPEKDLTGKIIGAAIEVHKYWGPGLIESVYEKSLEPLCLSALCG